jgi:hypothetical protein
MRTCEDNINTYLSYVVRIGSEVAQIMSKGRLCSAEPFDYATSI